MTPTIEQLSPALRDQLVAGHASGLSLAKLAARHGLSIAGVWKCLRRSGVVTSKPARTCTLNEAVFVNAAANPEAAYWVGFMMADGCVTHSKKNTIVVSASSAECDRQHLETFRRFLGSSHKIDTRERGGYHGSQRQCKLAVCSRRLADDLAEYGVVPRKTLNATVMGGLHLSRDFWRGCVDGDGYICWASGYPKVGLTGSKRITEQFADFIASSLGWLVRPHPNNTIWAVAATGSSAIAVLRLLYRDGDVALPRKVAKAIELLSWRSANGQTRARHS